MNVSSYIFRSPYPQQVQFGTPDPVAQAQQKSEENRAALEQIPDQTEQNAQAYVQQSGLSTSSAGSINVAASTTDSGVSSSLAEFTAVNTQIQAAEAYSQ